jgi:hypothetical protein
MNKKIIKFVPIVLLILVVLGSFGKFVSNRIGYYALWDKYGISITKLTRTM